MLVEWDWGKGTATVVSDTPKCTSLAGEVGGEEGQLSVPVCQMGARIKPSVVCVCVGGAVGFLWVSAPVGLASPTVIVVSAYMFARWERVSLSGRCVHGER